jgi:hypothetical protein
MVFGIFATLGGVLLLLGGAVVKNLGDQTGVAAFGDLVGGVVAVFGIVVLVIGIVQIFGGIGSWRGREWGRVIGLIYGVLGFLFGLAAAAGGRSVETGSGNGVVVGLVILLIYGFVTFALGFRWKGRAA